MMRPEPTVVLLANSPEIVTESDDRALLQYICGEGGILLNLELALDLLWQHHVGQAGRYYREWDLLDLAISMDVLRVVVKLCLGRRVAAKILVEEEVRVLASLLDPTDLIGLQRS